MTSKQMPHAANMGHTRGDNSSGQRLCHPHPTPTQAKNQPLFGANGKVCAWVTPDGALCKALDGSKHFLRQPAGIAFDRAILQQAQDLGAVRVWVKDRETGATYRATLETFLQHGVRLNRGFGDQLCLPFSFWQAHQRGETKQLRLL